MSGYPSCLALSRSGYPVKVLKSRRNAEALLTLLATAVLLAGLTITDLATTSTLSSQSMRIVILFAISVFAAHLVIRIRAPHADPILLPTAALLNAVGLIGIHRLDVANAARAVLRETNAPDAQAIAQANWTALGLGLLILTLLLMSDYRRLQRYTWTTMLVGFILLLLPLAPVIGREIRGATLWIEVFGFSFQPAEVAKIALAISFSGYLAIFGQVLARVKLHKWGIAWPHPRHAGPLVIAWLLSLMVLVFQRDLGTSLLFFGLFVVLLYIATQQRTWPILGAALFVAGSLLAWRMFSHVQTRVNLWLDPFSGDGTSQVAVGLYGLAGGGIFGTGLGQGYPQTIPFAESDFIFAALGEEIGIMGSVALLALYAVLVERALRIAVTARDAFSTLLAAGFATVIGLQAFVVIGGVTKLIPLTGLTTPFLSYGGSSLVANWVIVGILVVMSHAVRRPEVTAVLPNAVPPKFNSSDETEVIER